MRLSLFTNLLHTCGSPYSLISSNAIYTILAGKTQSGDPLEVYNKYKGSGEEFMVSGSDDFTLFLWNPSKSNKPVCRMTGHQQLINQVHKCLMFIDP